MAIKYRLSDKEKEKADNILQQREKEKERENEINNEIKNKINSVQEVLPTAKKSSIRKTDNPSYRQNRNVILPKVNIATSEMVKNAKSISRQEIRAKDEAENINQSVSRGGYNAVNTAISNTLDSFRNGVQRGSAGLANAVLLPIATQLQHYSNIGKRMGLFGKDSENVLEKAYNKILDDSDYISQKASYRDNVNANVNDNGVRTAGNVASSIGNMLPSIVSNIAIPGSGLLVTGVSAGGNAAQETVNEDRNNLIQSVATGILKGGIEAGTEKITGGNIVSKGSLDDIVGKTIASKVKTNIGKKIANKSYQFAGEMLEEQISDNAGYIVDKIIDNKDLPSLEEWWNNAGETNKMTFLTTLALNLAGLGGSSKITNEEVSPDIQQLVDATIKKAQSDPEMQTKIQSTINNVQNNTQNIQQNQVNNQRNLPEQQITQIENNVAQNQNMEQIDTENVKPQLDNILNNKELPMQSYIYEKSTNEKINNLREDASKYFNNSEKAHNYMKMLEKIIEDKDINIRLDANLKTADGRVANGSYSNGSITINPNSTRTGEFIAVHELTHAIGTKEMLNMVENYRKSNVEFDNSVKELLNNYTSTEITEEALSDISAQLFGTQEFINNVAESNPNIFKKIYNEIKYLWHQFKGYKNQDQFVNDLYYKWTQAYNSNNKLNTQNSYAIETNDKGYKYVRADRQVISGNNPEVWKKQAKNYIDEKIRNNKDVKVYAQDGTELTITRNTSGKATFRNEVRQADGTIRKLTDEEFASKLRAETHIDELGKISTHKNGPVADTKNHDFAKDGFTYRNAYFEDIDGQYYKITMSVGKNGDINTIYNVGKMQQAQKNRSNSTNRGFKDPNGNNTASSRISSINSITNSNEDVNTTTKYSIQESENNSGSFSMQDKRFDVTGNENLDNASTLFFRTREDGVYYVQAVNNSGKITYDGSFIDKHSLEKSLGTDIAEYIVNNSETTNNEIYLESSKVENKTDYMMTHRPSEEYGNGSNFERNMDGVFEHPEWYINMREDYNIESLNALKKVRKKPDAEIMIYRATPGNEINFGDWVTPSKKYAELHNNSQLDGKGNILKLKVKAKDILWGGDDINEFGYFPDNNKYSQNNKNWQSYLEDNYKSNGTKTNLQDIKQVAPSMANNKLSKASDTKNEDIPDTREYLTEKRTKDKVSFSEIKDTLAQRLVNKGHYIDKLAEKMGNNELKYKYDRTMNSFNEAQISIGEHQVDSNGKVVGKSLLEIFQPAKDMNLKTEFEDYLANKHNISRDVVGKNIYGGEVTAPQSLEIVKKYEESHPEFKQWSEEVSKYNDNNLRDLVNSGMVSENLYNNLKEMYGDYVPIYRDIVSNIQEYSDDKVGGNTLKRATKSGKEILSIEESMAEQTLSIKKAIRINEVGVELAKTLGKDSVILDNINFDPIAIETLGGDVISKAEDGTNIFTIFQNGEMSHFKISDEIYSAFAKNTIENKINNSKVAKTLLTPVEKLSKVQRNLLTTYSVGFALNNPIKDIQDAVFNTKYSTATFSKNYIKALYNLGTNGEWAQSYMNNGGNANTYFDYSKGLLPTKQNVVKKVANKILQVNEVLEQAPRLAEYISTIENGGTINEALYNAADITTNFKRGGDITKAVNKYGVNFLNASVQGLDKVYRNITGKNGVKGYANLLVKATMFQIAPAILNGLILGDDDDYDKLPEYTKDNYFLIKMSDDRFFRIPKGRVSSVVGGIARRALEKVQGKEVDWSSIVDTTVNQLAPNNPLTDNIVAPIIQAKNNKTWYGGDLVSSRLKKLPEAEQYDESTDSLSKFIGEKLNISPKKINYVLDQYSGGIGDVILPMMTPQAENNIIEDKFTTDSVMKNKNVSKYYSTLEELEKKKNSANATEEDKLKYKYMYDATEDLSGLYKQKREIQNSDINDNEKKTKVREIQKQINNIVEEKLNGLNSLSANGATGKVGDSEYYQSDGKWTSLSEKDEEKNANISLETYANYKNTVKQLTNKKRQNGELKDTEQLKDKDKIQILLNSKYSDKEKSAIYEEYILNLNNSTYNVMKSAGININEWLKYSKQEFTSDKKDDGTVNGSTVSGSKKKKVYAYIENMNITYSQKLLLKGMQYSLTDSEKNKLANYVRNLNTSNSNKLEIYSKLKGFTVYKDGTFDY